MTVLEAWSAAKKSEPWGKGPAAKSGDRVTVNYTGKLTDGTKYDSSKGPGRTPFQFALGAGEAIAGWDQAVAGMKVGGKRRLTISPDLGYGTQGQGSIPPKLDRHLVVSQSGV